MRVIGTAGHVDHGKSTLVEALTGIDPDRLKEEKEREMTIDLGFAWLKPGEDQDEIGIIDVPGHRDFIENMLAGVGGIDLALLVIAADEGVMPQTLEHLAILDLLKIQDGIVVLTKVDLIDDPDWLELVTLDVTEAISGTLFADAPIVPVSARAGIGIAELKTAIIERLESVETRPDIGRPRLPVDRVFTLAGFGTIVTGTLSGGHLKVGDAIEIQPAGIQGRIRGLQTHQTQIDVAKPGSRVAVNLSGIGKEQVNRGEVLAAPGLVKGTILCDASYNHLPNAALALKHNMEVKLHVGASETVARVRVLGTRQIDPAQHGWLQLALSQPVAMMKGDRFILRRPSPATTLGGGTILDPHPGRKHRRFKAEALSRLNILAVGEPSEVLLQAIEHRQPVSLNDVLSLSGLEEEVARSAWSELLSLQKVVMLDKWVMSKSGWQSTLRRMETILANFHKNAPLRAGMPREELRSRLGLKPTLFTSAIVAAGDDGMIMESGTLIHLPDHEIRFELEQQALIDRLMHDSASKGVNSPSVKEVKAEVGEDIYHALIDLGHLRQISEDVVYTADIYDEIVKTITHFLQETGRVNAAEIRDLLETSRKYAIALLEHLDESKVTRRVGDYRELVQ